MTDLTVPLEEATVTIDIPIEQVPQSLLEILMSQPGVFPYVDLAIDRARFDEPVEVEVTGGVMRFKATLGAPRVQITQH